MLDTVQVHGHTNETWASVVLPAAKILFDLSGSDAAFDSWRGRARTLSDLAYTDADACVQLACAYAYTYVSAHHHIVPRACCAIAQGVLRYSAARCDGVHYRTRSGGGWRGGCVNNTHTCIGYIVYGNTPTGIGQARCRRAYHRNMAELS